MSPTVVADRGYHSAVSGAIFDNSAWSKASSGSNPPQQLNKTVGALNKRGLHKMDVQEFQRLAVETVDKIDKKASLNRDAQLGVSQLIEELGELAKEVNREKLRNQKPALEDLEDEFADVLLQLCKLADLFGVDFEKAVSNKVAALKKRHSLD